MRSTRLLLALVAAATSIALTACGGSSEPKAATSGSWSDVVAAAKKEGQVTLYSSQNPKNLDSLKAAFEKKYPGIKMDYVRNVDADNATKIEAEKQTGNSSADVYVTATASWIKDVGSKGDYAVDVRGASFDAPAYKATSSLQDGKYFLVGAAVLGLGWNTDIFPQGAKSYDDLLDPSLSGKIGITEPTSGAYVDFYNFVKKHAGDDFLPELAKLKPRIYPSTLGISQALTSGELGAALVVQPLITEKESGAPVDWALPDPAWGARWIGMALSASPHPNAAQVLADFMVSEAGQVAMSQGYAAALPDIKGSVSNAQDVPEQDLSLQTPEAVAAYQEEWSALFE